MQSALFESLLLNAPKPPLPRPSTNRIPPYLYGCAWKKEATSTHVHNALSTGFRGIDVAAQPRHYREDLCGEGIRKAISSGVCTREDLFIQTKFSPVSAQDPQDCPYDIGAKVENQVETSILSSLRHLRHDPEQDSNSAYLDSVVLHSPLPTMKRTLAAWSTLSQYVPHQIRNLGISNVTLPVLQELYEEAEVKPAVVQNRFYRDTEYDIPLRKYCRDKGIVYQAFWTLTANPALLRHPSVVFLAKSVGVEGAVSLYALVMALEGVVVCNGTTSHMREDLEGLSRVREWVEGNETEWKDTVKKFKDATGDNNPGSLPVEAALGRSPLGRDRNRA